jgi:L-2,4-diaminobutyric acid acetyltransferase
MPHKQSQGEKMPDTAPDTITDTSTDAITGKTKAGNALDIGLRPPESADGIHLHALIHNCKPLDENSVYCNLLQCTHFADTCVAAEIGDELVGFISAYIPPKQPNTLFVWQVAVSEKARGQGLAKRMLDDLLQRDACTRINFIETTITPDNDASWAMFRSFAMQRKMPTEEFILFDSRIHFAGEHTEEHLLRIGPFRLPENALSKTPPGDGSYGNPTPEKQLQEA